MLAVVDADSLVYRCGFVSEKTFYVVRYLVQDEYGSYVENWSQEFDNANSVKKFIKSLGKGVTTYTFTRKEVEPLDHCLATVKASLNKIKDITEADSLKLYISGKRNFREAIYPDYKANRLSAPKPKHYKGIREYLVNHWAAEIVEDVEADDMLGIKGTELRLNKKPFILVTQDKDLDQVPGKHYDWTTATFEEITPEQGLRNFYSQVLTGDATDNIKGCPGIGPAKTKAALEGAKNPRHLAEIVLAIYRDTLGHDDHGKMGIEEVEKNLDLNATLCWILRKPGDTHPVWRHLGRE